ncbi:DUF309 domain-containing protein [Streptomyces sp. NPDC056943]|uniref:DUF309 domain-containing protein n=1 Tax=Streptomyces sp. NPDC056943 TaxID=3345971 RepID=UPI003624C44E
MNRTTRDRDEEGRARNARPRDGLGRPLPHGAEGVARQPEGVVRTPDETLREAQRLLDAGMPFHAHEVFEDAWKSGPEAERDLWQGLAQLAVGLTHAARGNREGGARLLRRGADRLTSTREGPGHEGPGREGPGHAGPGREGPGHAGPGHEGSLDQGVYGIDVGGLVAWARELADRIDGTEAIGAEVDAAAEAPRLRRTGA